MISGTIPMTAIAILTVIVGIFASALAASTFPDMLWVINWMSSRMRFK